jgi:hypothetical protein
MADAKRITKSSSGLSGLLKIASTKAMNAFHLVDKLAAAPGGAAAAAAMCWRSHVPARSDRIRAAP